MSSPITAKVSELSELCANRRWTVGFAESCTGGLLSSWVTEVPGASKFFFGSVVSYARNVKADVLKVPKPYLQAYGEVSEPVARAMARGAKSVMGCDWVVSITGIAGPSGGSPGKPVGTVCFAVVGPGFERVQTHLFPASLKRQDIQRRSAVFAFDLLLSAMR